MTELNVEHPSTCAPNIYPKISCYKTKRTKLVFI